MLTVDTFSLSSRAKNTTKNGILMFAASLLGAQHERDSVENKQEEKSATGLKCTELVITNNLPI